MTSPFNPLDMQNLASSIVNRLLETAPVPLADVGLFTGAGLYALYYSGSFPAYEPLITANSGRGAGEPLYVGKAVPSGGRRGLDIATSDTTNALSRRIREHGKSIQASTNLHIEDFAARWLVVEDIWIPLGESALIRRYRPIWNALVDGFGNHDPGKGRVNGVQSRWDTLHPGRPWTANFPTRNEEASAIEQEIQEYLRSRLQ